MSESDFEDCSVVNCRAPGAFNGKCSVHRDQQPSFPPCTTCGRTQCRYADASGRDPKPTPTCPACGFDNSWAKSHPSVANTSRRAGIGHVHPHRLRHTAAVDLLDKPGAVLTDVQHLLGHARASTTSRYVHARPHRLATLLEA